MRQLTGVATLGKHVIARTPSGDVSLGLIKEGGCVYGNCRARNLCSLGCCVGLNLLDSNYVIENGTLRHLKNNEIELKEKVRNGNLRQL